MRIDLNLLAVFDAIYAEGNLSRAARRLGMSQPGTSNALARLRAAFNDPLFRRTTSGMIPTARARSLALPIQQALLLLRTSIDAQEEFEYRTSKRCFVLAVQDYGEAVILPPLLDFLRQKAPNLQLKVRPILGRPLNELLLPGEADLAISYIRAESPDFRHCKLTEDSHVAVMRKGYRGVGAVLSLDQYLALPHVTVIPATKEGSLVDRALAKIGRERHVALQVQNLLSLPPIARSTDFICTLPLRIANIYAREFRLRILEPPVKIPIFPVFNVWHQSLDSDPGHRWLRESIAKVCERL